MHYKRSNKKAHLFNFFEKTVFLLIGKYIFCKNNGFLIKNPNCDAIRILCCDPGEARTLDPMIKSHLLYQLSYGVKSFFDFGCKGTHYFLFGNAFCDFF